MGMILRSKALIGVTYGKDAETKRPRPKYDKESTIGFVGVTGPAKKSINESR